MLPSKKPSVPEQSELLSAIRELNGNLVKLVSRYETRRRIVMSFLRGVTYGLGILVSIVIVVPILLWLLSTIDWIPFIGDIVSAIIERMENARY